MVRALQAMVENTGAGPNDLPVELQDLGQKAAPAILTTLYGIVAAAWQQNKVPQRWKEAIIQVLYK